MNEDNILTLVIVVLALAVCWMEIKSCGRYVVSCDQGTFICTRKFMCGEVICKISEDCWLIWPDDRRPRGMIHAHRPRLIPNEEAQRRRKENHE